MLKDIEKRLGYIFINKQLLTQAMTHSSYINENGTESQHNERLEFLGDAILEVMVSHYLYEQYQEYSEGKLTRMRAQVVCEEVLYAIAQKIQLGDFLELGKGEEASGGRLRKSILADALEALIAAVYLDSGLEPTTKVFMPCFIEYIHLAASEKLNLDFKTTLQEKLQKINPETKIRYQVYKEEGPDHDKVFYVKCFIDGLVVGTGKGKNKKSAEQEAANAALDHLGSNDES